MSIMYKCSHCGLDTDSVLDGATVIYNAHSDDEVVCDYCMDDIADRVREYYEDQQVAATYEEN